MSHSTSTPRISANARVHRRANRRSPNRCGAAVVELAFCLPVLVLLMLATMEACTMLYLQQKLRIAAYEGARVGIVPNANSGNVTQQCRLLLDSQNVRGYRVAMAPADPTQVAPGDFLQVTVSAPFAPNSLAGGWLYDDKTLTRSVSLQTK